MERRLFWSLSGLLQLTEGGLSIAWPDRANPTDSDRVRGGLLKETLVRKETRAALLGGKDSIYASRFASQRVQSCL